MTRETKVGMAVACSFLGLVGAVVVLRMGNAGDSSSTPATSGQVARAKPAAGGVSTTGKPATTEPGVLAAVFSQQGDSPPLPPAVITPLAVPTTPAVPSPAVAGPGAPPAVPPTASEPKNLPGSPGGTGAPAVQAKQAALPPAVVPGPADLGLPALPPAPVGNVATAAPPGPVAQNNKLSPEEEQRRKLEELKNQVAAMAQQDAPPPKPAVAAPEAPAPVGTLASTPGKGPIAQANDLLPPPPPLLPPAPAPVPGANGPPAVPPPPANNLVPPPAPTPVAKEDKLVPPAAPSPPDVTSQGPVGPMATPAGKGLAPGVVGKPVEAPTAVAMAPLPANNLLGERSGPLNTGGETQPPRAPQAVPLPQAPLGAPPGGSSAPITVPVPPTGQASGVAPKVQSSDVETHYCKPGENSFADLSKQLYGSEKYAPALLQFNREYPMAGENLRADPPRLQPNQPIYVPPAHILELPRYAAAPPVTRPSVLTGGPPQGVAPPPVAITPPAPAAVPTAPVANSRPTPAVPNTASTRTYTVRGDGEMLFEIARQALGDGRRWSEIYRLNPEIRPELAIPGGTPLRLPADALLGS